MHSRTNQMWYLYYEQDTKMEVHKTNLLFQHKLTDGVHRCKVVTLRLRLDIVQQLASRVLQHLQLVLEPPASHHHLPTPLIELDPLPAHENAPGSPDRVWAPGVPEL